MSERRFSITKKQGKIIISSLIFTYAGLSAILHVGYNIKIDEEYLKEIGDLYHTLLEYKWEKE